MAVHHSTKLVIDRDVLRDIADARLRDARSLLDAGHHPGAMFSGGSALECYLKVAICVALNLEGLPPIFKIHDLGVLILYSGLERALSQEPPIKASFDAIVKEWEPDGRASLLYRLPSELSREAADRFMAQLSDENTGVIPWLLRMLS